MRHGEGEDIADALAHSGQIESNYDETVDSFDTMNLKAELLRGLFGHTDDELQLKECRCLCVRL